MQWQEKETSAKAEGGKNRTSSLARSRAGGSRAPPAVRTTTVLAGAASWAGCKGEASSTKAQGSSAGELVLEGSRGQVQYKASRTLLH